MICFLYKVANHVSSLLRFHACKVRWATNEKILGKKLPFVRYSVSFPTRMEVCMRLMLKHGIFVHMQRNYTGIICMLRWNFFPWMYYNYRKEWLNKQMRIILTECRLWSILYWNHDINPAQFFVCLMKNLCKILDFRMGAIALWGINCNIVSSLYLRLQYQLNLN